MVSGVGLFEHLTSKIFPVLITNEANSYTDPLTESVFALVFFPLGMFRNGKDPIATSESPMGKGISHEDAFPIFREDLT